MPDIHFNQLGGELLPDKDAIRLAVQPGGAPAGYVGVALKLSGVQWWKGIQSGGIVLCQCQDTQNFSHTQLHITQIQQTGLQFWKAKFFGVHCPEYNVIDAAEHMKEGSLYTFTWSRDS